MDVMVVSGVQAPTQEIGGNVRSRTRTIHVETPDQLRKEWFTGVRKAGVTAGASTPDWLIEGVLKRMMEFTEDKVAQVTEGVEEEQDQVAAPEAEASEAAEAVQTQQTQGERPEEPQMEDFEVKLPTPGAIVKGRVVKVAPDEVLVDIDYKSEGRIPLNELSFLPNVQPADVVSEGDEISVKVLKVEDSEGTVLLSKKRADADQSWQKLEELQKTGGTLKAKVMQTVKGGLLVDVGVGDSFLPVTFPAPSRTTWRNTLGKSWNSRSSNWIVPRIM